MKGLSKKEIEVISDLEFSRKYFFKREEIAKHFKTKNQMRHTIHKLISKKRIISLNKNKYYLIPIKAKSGSWSEHSFIIADEACNGKDYFIGGWSAANYWRLTDQIPMQIDIYTTKRQDRLKVLNTMLVFHRTTKKRIKNAVTGKIEKHAFKIENKEDSQKWLKSRSYQTMNLRI